MAHRHINGSSSWSVDGNRHLDKKAAKNIVKVWTDGGVEDPSLPRRSVGKVIDVRHIFGHISIFRFPFMFRILLL